MPTTTLTSLPWNLITKNLHAHEQLHAKIRQKISKLERHLVHFPDGTVHLHIGLERHLKKELYHAALTLRIPSNILRAEKSAADIIKAFDDAVRALLRELESHKSALRREALWKRQSVKSSGFATEPEGRGPQNQAEVARSLLERESGRLLRYIRRHLWHDVVAGDLPRGAVEAKEVVDEVARRALSAPDNKPANRSFLVWLYDLARQEIARRRKELRTQGAESVWLDAPNKVPEGTDLAIGYDPDQPLDIIERRLEPPVADTEEFVADQRTEAPAEIVAQRDLLAETCKLAASWPKPDREVFELYYVEGFEPDEIAMLLALNKSKIQEVIGILQHRLRDEVLRQAEL